MLAYMFLIYLIGFLFTCFPSNKILNLINSALSGRLSHEQTLFQHFPISSTGRYIYQPSGGDGFFIDASFLSNFVDVWDPNVADIDRFILYAE